MNESARWVVLDLAVARDTEELPRRAHVMPAVEEHRSDRDDELAKTKDLLILGKLECGRHIRIAMPALHADKVLPAVAG